MSSTSILILAERLKERRKAVNMSQEHLACVVHCSYRSIQKWEDGHTIPRADMLLALAIALDVPTDWLLGLK